MKKHFRFCSVPMALPLTACCLAAAAVLPMPAADAAQGKLGPSIGPDVTSLSDGLSCLLNACPAVGRWELSPERFPIALETFTSACPDSAVILSLPLDSVSGLSADADASSAAAGVWNALAAFQTMTSHSPARFWLEGPPQKLLPDMAAAAQWQADFWAALASRTKESGASLLIPLDGLSAGQIRSLANQFSGERKVGFLMRAASGEVCTGEGSGALAFRKVVSALPASSALFLAPAALSAASLTDDAAARWLTWFDGELRRESRIQGAAVTLPSSGTASFESLGCTLAQCVSSAVPELDWSALAVCASEEGEEADGGTAESDAGSSGDGGSGGQSSSQMPSGGNTSHEVRHGGCSVAASDAAPNAANTGTPDFGFLAAAAAFAAALLGRMKSRWGRG